MEIVIRDYQKGEEKEIKRIGMAAFKSMEGLFVGTPKQAKVAVVDGKIAGTMMYTIYRMKDKSVAYITYAFVDPKYHGQGVGKQIYTQTIQSIHDQGVDHIISEVKGDNVGSFGLVERNGFQRCSFFEASRQLGFLMMLKLFFCTEMGIATGMDLWCDHVKQKTNAWSDFIWYLICNVVFCLGIAAFQDVNLLSVIESVLLVMVYQTVIGSAISIISKEKWKFRLNNCGALCTIVIAILGGFFPLTARWFPEKYEKTKKFKRELCISSLLEWFGLIILGLVMKFGGLQGELVSSIQTIAAMLILYRMIPTYPFTEYGGGRVFAYNKVLYVICFALSAVALNFVF